MTIETKLRFCLDTSDVAELFPYSIRILKSSFPFDLYQSGIALEIRKKYGQYYSVSKKNSLFSQKEALTHVFSCEFCEIFKNSFIRKKPVVAASILFLEEMF